MCSHCPKKNISLEGMMHEHTDFSQRTILNYGPMENEKHGHELGQENDSKEKRRE